MVSTSVADPGSGAYFGPGSGIPDPKPIFLIANDKFLGKLYFNSYCFGEENFLYLFKNKIIYNIMIFVATKNGSTKKIPPLFVLLLDPGSGMDENLDPGSRINIPDPQH